MVEYALRGTLVQAGWWVREVGGRSVKTDEVLAELGQGWDVSVLLCWEGAVRPVSAKPTCCSCLAPATCCVGFTTLWLFFWSSQFIFTISFFFLHSFSSPPPLLDRDFEEPTVTLAWG